jgi:hypothetical protein
MSALATVLVAHASHADEPEKARCAAAYESAQELQRKDALNAARKQLVVCSETCPGRLRRDCLTWIDDIDALMPTIVLRPRDPEGRAIGQARVTIDGELLAETIDPSAALPVDPGTHVVRFEHPNLVPAEVRVTIHGAERGREVAITLWRRPSPDTAQPRSIGAGQVPSPAPASADGHRPSAYVFGIGGLAAIAVGGGLAIAGHVKRSDLSSSCAPLCEQSDVDTVVTLWRVGTAAALVGAVSLGIGTVLWFTPPTRAAGHRRVWIGVAGTGGALGGAFD